METPTETNSVVELVRGAGAALLARYGRDAAAEPEELDEDETFLSAVEALASSDLSANEVLKLARDGNEYVSCIALAAVDARGSVPPELETWAWKALRKSTSAQDEYIFRALLHADAPLIGKALISVERGVSGAVVARFVTARRARGEQFDLDAFRDTVPRHFADELRQLVESYPDELWPGFGQLFDAWLRETVDVEFLAGVGTLWERPFDSPPAQASGRRAEVVDVVAEALDAHDGRSVLLVGEHGVGKTSLARAAAERVPGLDVVQATAGQLQAGAVFIGELEARVKEFVDNLRGKPIVWHLPDLGAALHAGQHHRSPYGLLDLVLPAATDGDIKILAEATPETAERVLAERPQVASAFQMLEVPPLAEPEAVAVALHALEHDPFEVTATEETLRSAHELAEQFLPRIASPGNLLSLVRAAAKEAAAHGQSELRSSSLVAALARSSGLPLAMLDASVPLELRQVEEFFSSRVLGQDEAVQAVVERIAMIKAGVTDPTRPLGVFLFVGPTGTGKTEIAKTLAEFLFGSPDRLVRLDMSEYQTPEAFDRLLADTSVDGYGAPLVAAIRRHPFSVVLLDEFDKSAAPVWDLFLQAFDDGRLTDQRGRLLDLRRCVIILTSNVGSSIATRPGVGFDASPTPFRAADVARELERSFRPELLNRIDRTVVFQPFERGQMRALLDKELASALTRRGLRERPWAVELDDSAYEFLIDQGFSPALGARPLKRAVERHLLAPLAAAIVEQRAPSGDQFLLVSAPRGMRIEVTFVDPDAELADEPHRRPDATLETELDLRSLALAPRSGPQHTRFLLQELSRIGTAIRSDDVLGRKNEALSMTRRPSFWDDEMRFATLGLIEYLDRLETALETAERLSERLERRDGDRGVRLHEMVARRLYVLDRALAGLDRDAPLDIYLRIRRLGERRDGESADYVTLLAEMYAGWAEQRGMRLERLAETPDEQVFAVGGLGCGEILADEAGHHILEVAREDTEGSRLERRTAVVDVAPRSPEPAHGPAEVLARARAAFHGTVSNPAIVRRYRLSPDPLVRDSVRGYRTGKVERVLAGDFDLF
jgi:ATP-dependent Clp protease ATP-binding subunit ClpC